MCFVEGWPLAACRRGANSLAAFSNVLGSMEGAGTESPTVLESRRSSSMHNLMSGNYPRTRDMVTFGGSTVSQDSRSEIAVSMPNWKRLL